MISLNVELDASPPGGEPSTKYLERHQILKCRLCWCLQTGEIQSLLWTSTPLTLPLLYLPPSLPYVNKYNVFITGGGGEGNGGFTQINTCRQVPFLVNIQEKPTFVCCLKNFLVRQGSPLSLILEPFKASLPSKTLHRLFFQGVANWPKIRPQNSKGADKKSCGQRNMLPNFSHRTNFLDRCGRKILKRVCNIVSLSIPIVSFWFDDEMPTHNLFLLVLFVYLYLIFAHGKFCGKKHRTLFFTASRKCKIVKQL